MRLQNHMRHALQLRNAGTAGMAVDVCLPRRWRNSILELPHIGVRCLSPHLRCGHLTPGYLSSSLSLTYGIVGSMGMPIVVPKPYTKSERVTLTDLR